MRWTWPFQAVASAVPSAQNRVGETELKNEKHKNMQVLPEVARLFCCHLHQTLSGFYEMLKFRKCYHLSLVVQCFIQDRRAQVQSMILKLAGEEILQTNQHNRGFGLGLWATSLG